MIARAYEALVLDLDGTLLDDRGEIHPRNLSALLRLRDRGVRIMVATGRSELGARPILDQLGLDTPALVYNGAALFDPGEERFLEERLLANEAVSRSLAYASERDLLAMVQRAGAKFAPEPRDDEERLALDSLEGLSLVPSAHDLPTEWVIRVTLFTGRHADSAAFAQEIEAIVDRPIHLTHFPLNALPSHRASRLFVADIQPPSRGKGEALRILQERYAIPAERVVAVGDATNDLAMLEGAGLGVAMANAMEPTLAIADRVIGDNNGDALAQLITELFPE